ncbi:MAG: hypothetical protein GEU80_16295 [Dehalococcoidia bacterium]|nr:hypothetical protein [Dehalococcoidia bacterium]
MPGELHAFTDPPEPSAVARPSDARLISFDIDGTLEVGQPPGVIPLDVVRRATDLGFVVGSCSDRPIGFQRDLWAAHELEMDFVVLKQNLGSVRQAFAAGHYLHIGDSLIDRMVARESGFHFIHAVEDDVMGLLAALRLTPPASLGG